MRGTTSRTLIIAAAMIDRNHFFCIAATILMIPVSTAIADDAQTCQCPVTGEKVVVAEAEASSTYTVNMKMWITE